VNRPLEMNQTEADSGMILPLAAIFAFTAVMIVAFALFVSAFSATRQQVEAGARLMALAAVQGYAETSCPDPNDIAACDQIKKQGALQRAKRVLAANEKVFTGFSLNESGNSAVSGSGRDDRDERDRPQAPGPKSSNFGTIEVGRYDFSEPPQGGECVSYPCFYTLDGTELANSVRITGEVFNSGTTRLLNSFGFDWARPIPFEITAAQIPIRLVVMMDLSGSMAEDTHLPPTEELADQGASPPRYRDRYTFADSTRHTEPANDEAIREFPDYGTSPSGGSEPSEPPPDNDNEYFGSDPALIDYQQSVAPSTGASSGGGRAAGANPESDPDDDSVEQRAEASVFAFPIEALEEPPNVTPEEVKLIWDHMQDNRPSKGPYDPTQHFKDDYLQISSIGLGPGAYDGYGFKELHPPPGHLGIIWEPDQSELLEQYNKELYYLVDSYRNPEAGMNGPEPYLSAMQGLHEVIQALRARQVAGDKMGLVFYDTQLYWNYVVNLTDNFDYIESLIDPQNIVDASTADFPNTMQPWLRLGLFPAGGAWTNIEKPLVMAALQLSVSNEDGIPAVNEIIAFGDGLPTCTQYGNNGELRCESDYVTYKQSMDWITDFASTFLFYNKISLHVVQAGDQVGPHLLRMAHYDKNKDPTCMTDELARLAGISLVKGQDEIENEWYGQNLYGNRFNVPFFQAAYDWYRLAVITGGVYAPIRPSGSTCPDPMIANNCEGLPDQYQAGSAERQLTDPLCRTPAQQVSEALAGMLKGSVARSYAIVDSGHGKK